VKGFFLISIKINKIFSRVFNVTQQFHPKQSYPSQKGRKEYEKTMYNIYIVHGPNHSHFDFKYSTVNGARVSKTIRFAQEDKFLNHYMKINHVLQIAQMMDRIPTTTRPKFSPKNKHANRLRPIVVINVILRFCSLSKTCSCC
jgi:hypothetical protein